MADKYHRWTEYTQVQEPIVWCPDSLPLTDKQLALIKKRTKELKEDMECQLNGR